MAITAAAYDPHINEDELFLVAVRRVIPEAVEVLFVHMTDTVQNNALYTAADLMRNHQEANPAKQGRYNNRVRHMVRVMLMQIRDINDLTMSATAVALAVKDHAAEMDILLTRYQGTAFQQYNVRVNLIRHASEYPYATDVMRLLMTRASFVDDANDNALGEAMSNRDYESVDRILEGSTHLDVPKTGAWLLWIAVKKGTQEIAMRFLDDGIDYDWLPYAQELFELAMSRKMTDVARVLIASEKKSLLQAAVKRQTLERLDRWLLKQE